MEEERCGGYASCLNGARRSRSIYALLLYSSTPSLWLKKKKKNRLFSPSLRSIFVTIKISFASPFSLRSKMFSRGFAGSQMPPTSAKYPPPPTTTTSPCLYKNHRSFIDEEKKQNKRTTERRVSANVFVCCVCVWIFLIHLPASAKCGNKRRTDIDAHLFFFPFFFNSFQFSTK